MRLSDNLTLQEVIKSDTAIKNGISNEPTPEHLESLKIVANEVFQKVREYFNVPIYVSSGYRSKELNDILPNASSTSQHCKGEALDLDADVFGKISNNDIFSFIAQNMDFDQLIWEFGDDKNPDWVHVSYTNKRPNRKIIMKAERIDGRTYYKNIG